MSSVEKMKKYNKAYKKCISNCELLHLSNCKKTCNLLNFKLKMKSPSPSRKKRSNKRLNSYQKFVKKEYHKYTHLNNKDRIKALAEEWRKNF